MVVVLELVLQKGGLVEEAIGEKVIYFGADGHLASKILLME